MQGNIKNIIFDFGGVIIPVDPMAYAAAMVELGCRDIKGLHERFQSEEVYIRFEKGEMSPEEFRMKLRSGITSRTTDEQLDQAWNRMLGEIPAQRVRLLEELKGRFRTFLLSNTNRIHHISYNYRFCKTFGYPSLDNLFEKAYYSYQIGLYKPDPSIYDHVLQDSLLNPFETVFIDDNHENVRAAEKCGIIGIHLKDFDKLEDVLPTVHQSFRISNA